MLCRTKPTCGMTRPNLRCERTLFIGASTCSINCRDGQKRSSGITIKLTRRRKRSDEVRNERRSEAVGGRVQRLVVPRVNLFRPEESLSANATTFKPRQPRREYSDQSQNAAATDDRDDKSRAERSHISTTRVLRPRTKAIARGTTPLFSRAERAAHNLSARKMLDNQAIEASRCNSLLGFCRAHAIDLHYLTRLQLLQAPQLSAPT